MSRLEIVYIKVSGAFPEMGSVGSMTADKIADRIAPYFDHTLKEFTPKRVMYGSDWPLVNMNGGGDKGWGLWKSSVAEMMVRAKLSEIDKARIWVGTATEAYRLKI